MALTWVRTHPWDVSAWRDRSACRDSDPDLFFPVGSGPVANEQLDVARGICGGCAVRRECLDFALATRQDDGVWGGTTEDERRDLRTGRAGIAVVG